MVKQSNLETVNITKLIISFYNGLAVKEKTRINILLYLNLQLNRRLLKLLKNQETITGTKDLFSKLKSTINLQQAMDGSKNG